MVATHIGQKIRNQNLYRLEDIPFLLIPDVSMVALSSLIVIADETLPPPTGFTDIFKTPANSHFSTQCRMSRQVRFLPMKFKWTQILQNV
jgi:hypothetical protein